MSEVIENQLSVESKWETYMPPSQADLKKVRAAEKQNTAQTKPNAQTNTTRQSQEKPDDKPQQ